LSRDLLPGTHYHVPEEAENNIITVDSALCLANTKHGLGVPILDPSYRLL
jgi:hypothetical protein